MDMSVENDIRFDEFLVVFQKILQGYEYRLYGYNYKIFQISKSQYVFFIENSFAVLAYITRSRFITNDYNFINCAHSSDNIPELFEINFEELLYNEVFFFSATSFIKEMRTVCKSIFYKKFNSTAILDCDKNFKNFESSIFYYVHKKLSKLHLLEMFDDWEGHLYNYIVYEYKLNEQVGYASFYTSSVSASYEAYQKENVLECGLMSHYAYPNNSSGSRGNFYHEGMVISPELKNIGIHLIETGKAENWKNLIKKAGKQSFLSDKLRYFIVPIHLKRIDNEITSCLLKEIVIENAKKGKYSDIDRSIYTLTDYKWTSELLCYQLMSEIYKKNIVVHQYRPLFLKTEKGQMSYDVFVYGKNIALEYQGRQHFEPLEIFGGKDNFEKQKERDKLKYDLSIKNGIHLIYINYWESITKDLIRNKIKAIIT